MSRKVKTGEQQLNRVANANDTLNGYLKEIEGFANRVTPVLPRIIEYQTSNGQLTKRKRSKMRNTLVKQIPSGVNFMEIFQKYKLTFNLIAHLSETLKNPAPRDLLGLLMESFEPILQVCELAHSDIAPRTFTPLLTPEAKELLRGCLKEDQMLLLESLGDAWTLKQSELPYNSAGSIAETVSTVQGAETNNSASHIDKEPSNKGPQAALVQNGDAGKQVKVTKMAVIEQKDVPKAPASTSSSNDTHKEKQTVTAEFLEIQKETLIRLKKAEDLVKSEQKKIEEERKRLEEEKQKLEQERQRIEATSVRSTSVRSAASSIPNRPHSSTVTVSPDMKLPTTYFTQFEKPVQRVRQRSISPARSLVLANDDQQLFLMDMRAKHAKVVRAMYGLSGEDSKQLSVRRGEYLEVLDDRRNWWKCRNKHGDEGYVPYTILQISSAIEAQPPFIVENVIDRVPVIYGEDLYHPTRTDIPRYPIDSYRHDAARTYSSPPVRKVHRHYDIDEPGYRDSRYYRKRSPSPDSPSSRRRSTRHSRRDRSYGRDDDSISPDSSHRESQRRRDARRDHSKRDITPDYRYGKESKSNYAGYDSHNRKRRSRSRSGPPSPHLQSRRNISEGRSRSRREDHRDKGPSDSIAHGKRTGTEATVKTAEASVTAYASKPITPTAPPPPPPPGPPPPVSTTAATPLLAPAPLASDINEARQKLKDNTANRKVSQQSEHGSSVSSKQTDPLKSPFQAELQETVTRSFSQRFQKLKRAMSDDNALNVCGTDPKSSINETSSPDDVQRWLQDRGFSMRTTRLLEEQTGSTLFALGKRQLQDFAGRDEGSRLYSHLLVQKSKSGLAGSGSKELTSILKQQRVRAETAPLANQDEQEPVITAPHGSAQRAIRSQISTTGRPIGKYGNSTSMISLNSLGRAQLVIQKAFDDATAGETVSLLHTPGTPQDANNPLIPPPIPSSAPPPLVPLSPGQSLYGGSDTSDLAELTRF